ncbi:BURP domain protein USPL1 [Capsicum annuum]|uniref:BURP domain protein USPL1 n=1 Tax=Capsicum annuum TaxID=4072 RepID=UPI001FB0938C|nr:BURP domain protein USPL1 [Capsicum annuum]
MDLNFGFCVLLSLILLVACGTKARKIVEGNAESLFISQDNHQEALKAIYGSEYKFKQGAEDKYQQEISGLNVPILYKYHKLYGYAKGAEDIHQPEISPSVRSLFFLMDDLKIGKTITNPSFLHRASMQYFPQKATDSIPFLLKELPNLLQRFSLSKNSPHAKPMIDALKDCESESLIKGETRYCATSAEAMLDFVQGIMGDNTQIEALSTTTHFSEEHSTTPLQNYTILDAQEFTPPKMVACHLMPSIYTVFYCHSTVGSKGKVFKVSLGNKAKGDRVETMALCHFDTSEWSPSHVSFQVLGILPGTSPVCHFFTSGNDLVWVPKTIDAGHEVRSLEERST